MRGCSGILERQTSAAHTESTPAKIGTHPRVVFSPSPRQTECSTSLEIRLVSRVCVLSRERTWSLALYRPGQGAVRRAIHRSSHRLLSFVVSRYDVFAVLSEADVDTHTRK